MNDYLSNLLARSFEQTEGVLFVRPRVPSLFEPPQEPWGHSPEIHSRPSGHHRQNDAETSFSSSSKAGEEPEGLDQVTERSINRDTTPNTTSEDVPHPHRRPMQTLKGTSEKDPRNSKPAREHLPRPDPRTVIIQEISVKPSGDRSPQSTGQDDAQEPATDRMKVPISTEMVPTSAENGGRLSVRGRREEGATQPPGKTGENHLAVGNAIMKEGIEQILDRNRSSPAEVGERRDLMLPMMQRPLEQAAEPTALPWMDSARRKAPAQAEPVIHVTIGRVEVRATMSSQKPTGKSEKPVPAMGLEEYLRRRSGGRD